MTPLPHRLDRTVVIHAGRDTVFRYFTDASRWAAWWGAGSTIDATPGGRVYIRYPNGVEAAGEVIDVAAPERVIFTFGYVAGTPMPPGGSRVTIRLEPVAGGTRLHLEHLFADPAARDPHVQGWRYQLSVFANVVADDVFAGATQAADAWFGAWAETDADARGRRLAAITTPDVRFRDRFSLIDGLEDLNAHVGASQHFMPGVQLRRHGDVRHCQGTLLVDWVAVGADSRPQGSGTNVFALGADGRIHSVMGFWAPRTT